MVGIRVVLQVVSEITPLAFGNTTAGWSAFADLVNRMKTLDNLTFASASPKHRPPVPL